MFVNRGHKRGHQRKWSAECGRTWTLAPLSGESPQNLLAIVAILQALEACFPKAVCFRFRHSVQDGITVHEAPRTDRWPFSSSVWVISGNGFGKWTWSFQYNRVGVPRAARDVLILQETLKLKLPIFHYDTCANMLLGYGQISFIYWVRQSNMVCVVSDALVSGMLLPWAVCRSLALRNAIYTLPALRMNFYKLYKIQTPWKFP
jgi:hypothetical protein